MGWAVLGSGRERNISDKAKIAAYLLLGSPLFYLLHGLAGFKSLGLYLCKLFFGYKIRKGKTEMFSYE